MDAEHPDRELRGEAILLRIFAVAPLLFLAASLLIDFARRGAFLASISAYYGSPVRDVFVGSLVALGVVYVIYRGTTDFEDRALDLAGFFVVIVALVPHNYEKLLKDIAAPAVARDTLTAILAAWVVISAVFYGIQLWWRSHIGSRYTKRSVSTQVKYALPWVVFVAFGTVWIGTGQPYDAIHFVAAALVVLCLIVVVGSHALGYEDTWIQRAREQNPGIRRAYWFIAACMLGGLILGGLLFAVGNQWWVLITEIVEIGAFLAFWVINLVVTAMAVAAERRADEQAPSDHAGV